MFPRRLINNKNAVLSAMKRSFSKEAASAPKEAPKVAKDIPKKEGGGGSSFFVFVAATGAFLYADPFELKEIKKYLNHFKHQPLIILVATMTQNNGIWALNLCD